MQVVDKGTILVSYGYLQREILGIQSEAFSRSKLEGF
jgi:hypothetical protein